MCSTLDHTLKPEATTLRRLEVITGTGRRRQFSEDFKAGIVEAQNDRLRQIIKELQRHRFGRRAETLPEDQMLLGLEDVEQAAAGDEAKIDAANPAERVSRAKRRLNRGSLPAYLPRIEMVLWSPTLRARARTCDQAACADKLYVQVHLWRG